MRPWQSREGSAVSYRLPLKWHAPIASVAALTAQPLAALPPYGCGVPFTGGERHAGWHYLRHKFIGARPPSLSFRGAKRRGNLLQPVTFSPRPTCYPTWYCEIAASAAPPRNDTSGWRSGVPMASCGWMALYRAVTDRPYSGRCGRRKCPPKNLQLPMALIARRRTILRPFPAPGGACPSRIILHQRVVSTVISPETIFFDSSSTAVFTSSGTCCAAPSSP